MTEESVYMDVFFYWLAALPPLVALLVWLYFWRQKYLVQAMMQQHQVSTPSSSNNNYLPSNSEIFSYSFNYGLTIDNDLPPSYNLYQSYPIVHNEKVTSSTTTTIFIEDLEKLPPPPCYTDAIKMQNNTAIIGVKKEGILKSSKPKDEDE